MKKKGSPRSADGGKSRRLRPDAPPLTFEQLLERKNTPATQPVPARVRQLLSTTRVYVQSSGDRLAKPARFTKLDDTDAGYRLELPDNARLGAPGRSGGAASARELAKYRPAQNHAAGYCPPWMEKQFHPIPSLAGDHDQAVTHDGAVITPHRVFPPEDRVVYYPKYYPMSLIGRVFTLVNGQSAGGGTGVLIGRRHVLTAAHICPWNAPNWGMMFFPGFYDGVSVAGNGAMSWASDWRALANVTAQDSVRSSDLAVLRLYDPLGDALGFFGAKVYQPGWGPLTWGLHGYPSAIANALRPSGHAGIGVIRANADGERLELTHRGDATAGDSGAPLWHFWGDDIAYAIGVQSAGRVNSTEDVNVAAGGLAMVNMINFWRNTWP